MTSGIQGYGNTGRGKEPGNEKQSKNDLISTTAGDTTEPWGPVGESH